MMEIDGTVPAGASSNGHGENEGFMDPNFLHQFNDLEVPESNKSSTDAKSSSSDESDETVPTAPFPLKRPKWLPTGCCYDDRMKWHANADFSKDPPHPEDPRRIEAIMKAFKDGGLIYTGPDSQLRAILEQSPTQWMYRISARNATKAEVCTVHIPEHFQWVEALSSKSSQELKEMTTEMDAGRKSLYVGNLTYQAALIAAGGAIETCKNVVSGKVKNAIAVIRPPGHHAERDQSMGFCIFNNVPIAARVCQLDYPISCRKILILDWDVHHGNGVQNIFYDDPNVLYISLHVYDNGHFYPGQPEDDGVPDGGLDKCGVGPGIGKNVNIGWHDQGMGDGEYMAAFQRIVMPIAQEFDPDLVIVSAGFDAAAGDELGGCFVTPACYSHMTHMLMSLAKGKVAVCLEGGYNLKAISRSALAVAQTLMGYPPERLVIPPINREAALVLNQVKEYQARYWECMRPGRIDPIDTHDAGSVRLNDVIRAYQRRGLSNNHKMVSLYVQREKLSKSFENQVLVTQSLHAAKRILLIIHDPPEIMAIPDPISAKVESHNAWLNDGVMPYIDWAIANNFGVIDVNIPMHIESEDEKSGYLVRPTEAEHQEQMKELMCYLWDNYLEGYESDDIVLMGVGDSYLGVKQLLTSRDSKFKIRSIVNFVTGSLRPIKSETDPNLSSWYKQHSRVYVASDHACWADEVYSTKVRKSRFGRVVKSEAVGLNRMMALHREEAMAWILDSLGESDSMETE